MSASTIIKTKRDGEIVLGFLGAGAFNLATGALLGAADSLTITLEPGDFQISGPQEGENLFLDRGQIGSPPQVRYGDDQPITGSFNVDLTEFTDAAAGVLMDILNQTGFAAANFETVFASAAAAADHEVWGCDIRYRITNQGDATDVHTLILRWCTLRYSFAEGDPDRISVTFTSYQARPAAML